MSFKRFFLLFFLFFPFFSFSFFALSPCPFTSSCTRRDLIFKLSKGYRGRGNNVYSVAKPRVQKALQKAYRNRKTKKREMRSIWITQINAAARLYGLTYSTLINGLQAANVEVDRKSLSELAMFEPFSFRALTKVAEQHAVKSLRVGDPRIVVPKQSAYDQKT